VLNKTMAGLLGDSLSRAGLDPAKFDLIATPFTTSDPGFGQVLDNVTVIRNSGTLLLRDALSNRETTLSFDAAHHAVTISSDDLSGRTGTSHASVVLQ
jgi:hypothetical protein